MEDRKSIERAFAVGHRFLPDRLQSRNDRDKLSISFQRFEEVPMPTKVAPLPARAAPRKTKAPGIVSSSHLGLGQERRALGARVRPDRRLERVLALGGSLHGRRRLPELTITDVLVLHHICHRARNKKVGDICFVLNVEDTHVVAYSLKKLLAAGLAQGEKVGKEVFYSPTRGRRDGGREVPRGARGVPDRQPRRRAQRRHRRERAPAADDVGPLRPGRARGDVALADGRRARRR